MAFLKSIFAAPRSLPARPEQRQRLLVPMRTAGMVVDYETALKYSAVWRCVSLIASTLAMLPWHVFEVQRRDDRIVRRQVEMNNPVDWALHRQANPEMSAFDARQLLVAWALLDGNGYAEIERDRAGRVTWLWPIVPERVTPGRNELSGELEYLVRNQRGTAVTIPLRDMFHVKGLGFDGLVGYSVVSMAARSIGLGLAMEEFGSAYFNNGITPSGVLEHPKNLGPDAYERLKTSLKEEHGGGPQRAYSPLILEEGMVWKAIAANPEEAQMLENRRFGVSDIGRWFGVPMVLLEEKDASSWGTGIEQILIAFDKFGLGQWVSRLEAEADIKLFGPQQRGRMIAKLNRTALVRGDLKARREWYKVMRDLGVFSPNDIRELEDLNPIGPEGDKRLVPLNMTTLEKAGEDPPARAPAPADDEPGLDNDEDGEGDSGDGEGEGEDGEDEDEDGDARTVPDRSRVLAAQRAVLDGAMRHVIAYEAKKAQRPLARYRGDRRAFVQWMDKFFRGQAGHMRSTLTAPVNAVIQITGARVHAESVVDECIERHVQLARLSLLDAFDNDTTPQMPEAQIAVDLMVDAVL